MRTHGAGSAMVSKLTTAPCVELSDRVGRPAIRANHRYARSLRRCATRPTQCKKSFHLQIGTPQSKRKHHPHQPAPGRGSKLSESPCGIMAPMPIRSPPSGGAGRIWRRARTTTAAISSRSRSSSIAGSAVASLQSTCTTCHMDSLIPLAVKSVRLRGERVRIPQLK